MRFTFTSEPKKIKGRKKGTRKPTKPKAPPTTSAAAMFEYCLVRVPVNTGEMVTRAIMAPDYHDALEPEVAQHCAYSRKRRDAANCCTSTHQTPLRHHGHAREQEETQASRERERQRDERLDSLLASQGGMQAVLEGVDKRLAKLENGAAAVGKSNLSDEQRKPGVDRPLRDDHTARSSREPDIRGRFEADRKRGREEAQAAEQQTYYQEQLVAEAEQRGFQRAREEAGATRCKNNDRHSRELLQQECWTGDRSDFELRHLPMCYYAEGCRECRQAVLEQVGLGGHAGDTGRLSSAHVLPRKAVEPFAMFSTVPSGVGARYEFCPSSSYHHHHHHSHNCSDQPPFPPTRARPWYPH